MLQRDYLLEVIAQFVETVLRALKAARAAADPTAAIEAAQEAEAEVAGLLDMDAVVALSLEPESLVTMIDLSGMGEALASYVAFTLDRIGDVYDRSGDAATADLRHAQARALADVYACDPTTPPEELAELKFDSEMGSSPTRRMWMQADHGVQHVVHPDTPIW